MTAYDLLTISIITCAVSWLVFSAWYTIRAKWWKKAMGWNTIGASLLITLLVGRIALIRITDDSWDFTGLGIGIYFIGTALAVQRLVFLEKAQREKND